MQARAGIREVHFFPFNPVDKRTALTYIDSDGNWHRASKGAPEQVAFLPYPFGSTCPRDWKVYEAFTILFVLINLFF